MNGTRSALARRSARTIDRLGSGVGFPFQPGLEGDLDLVDGADKVAQAIRIILDTEPGERIMRPQFGCGLRRYLMKPNSVAVRALIRRDVELALDRWEPRIELREVRVDPGRDPSLVVIAIDYVHVQDGRPGNLVYPFYLE